MAGNSGFTRVCQILGTTKPGYQILPQPGKYPGGSAWGCRGVCLTRVAPCKRRAACKHSDSRMALAISAPLLAQIQTCICVSSSVTCVQKRTVSGQLVRIHCPNSQWSRRPLHAPFFILMAAPRCYTRNIAETAITRIIVSEAIGT